MTTLPPISSVLLREMRGQHAPQATLGRDLTSSILERVTDERQRIRDARLMKRAVSFGVILGIALMTFLGSVWQLIARIFDSDLDQFFSVFVFDVNIILERVGSGTIALVGAGLAVSLGLIALVVRWQHAHMAQHQLPQDLHG